MIKYSFVAAAAVATFAHVAIAQNTSSETTTSTQSTSTVGTPVTQGYSASKVQKSIDANGTVVEKDRSYQSGPGGVEKKSSATVKSPDGSRESTYHEERSTAPAETTSTTSNTSTTSTGQ